MQFNTCLLGDVEEAVKVALPILEDLFKMPARGPPEGSPQWISTMKSNPHLITFQMMDDYFELMRAQIKWEESNSLNGDGYPMLTPKEKQLVAKGKWPKYAKKPRATVMKETRRCMSHHANFKFMRTGGVTYAFGRMRENNVTPLKMNPKFMPVSADGQRLSWNNYSKCLRMFRAYYCNAAGIHMTQDMARELLIYAFYGKAKYLKSYKPCLAVLHKKLVTGMHRFTVEHKVRHNFGKFVDLIEHQPELKPFLTDKGQGTPPVELLVAVEAGLRMTAKDKFAMGTTAYNSKDHYHKVELWRKREAYIGACRLVLGCGNYLKYVSYRWDDYIMRGRLTKTFLARHWKITNGESDALSAHFADDFEDSQMIPSHYPPRRGKKTKPKSNTKETQSKRVYDSDEEEWKDLE